MGPHGIKCWSVLWCKLDRRILVDSLAEIAFTHLGLRGEIVIKGICRSWFRTLGPHTGYQKNLKMDTSLLIIPSWNGSLKRTELQKEPKCFFELWSQNFYYQIWILRSKNVFFFYFGKTGTKYQNSWIEGIIKMLNVERLWLLKSSFQYCYFWSFVIRGCQEK